VPSPTAAAPAAALVALACIHPATALPAPPPSGLAEILDRAARYVTEYEQAFRDIAAEETYTQWTEPLMKTPTVGPPLLCSPAGCKRTTVADVV